MFLSDKLLAQDYVITNNGDTIVGEIKEPLFEYLFYHRVVFKTDERKVYFATGLRSYKYGHVIYETHDVGYKKPNLVFLKPIVTGFCTLYEYQYVTTMNEQYNSSDPTRRLVMSQPQIDYYLKKPHEKLHKYVFSVLKNGKDLYFLDNSALTFDLHKGKYRRADIEKIVKRYNLEKESTVK